MEFSKESLMASFLFDQINFVLFNSKLDDLEGASDDEKGQMLHHQHNPDDQVQSIDEANVPLQSKQEDEM